MSERSNPYSNQGLFAEAKPDVEQRCESQFEYKFLTDPEQRELLARSVDELVERVKADQSDVVFFLDKSARPLRTVFQEIWKNSCPDKTMPKLRFLNIGREAKNMIDPAAGFTLENIMGVEDAQKMKEQFVSIKDARKILVMDEYSMTGQSLDKAKGIIHELSPQAVVDVYAVAVDEVSSLFDRTQFKPFLRSIGGGVNRAPWSMREDEEFYGIGGVVDSKEGGNPLLARASWQLSPEQRRERLLEINVRENDEAVIGWLEFGKQLPERVSRLLKRLSAKNAFMKEQKALTRSIKELSDIDQAKMMAIADSFLKDTVDIISFAARQVDSILQLPEGDKQSRDKKALALYETMDAESSKRWRICDQCEQQVKRIEIAEHSFDDKDIREGFYDYKSAVNGVIETELHKFPPSLSSITQRRQRIMQSSKDWHPLGPEVRQLREELKNIAREYVAVKRGIVKTRRKRKAA